MKRRNAEGGKLRRPIKRNKITENINGSQLLYLKFLFLWTVVLLADYILEFRFEFLWPFWLLLRSVYDSFKYQGLAFSVFFVCVAATSDMICYFFIPVHWLFFLASTYVWVQYVWHIEKGVCFPTVILCTLFVYVEAAIRLRHFRQIPYRMDLGRPFAAHCIGYPVVTFGFGFKSYISYRLRQRRQKEVAKENEFYMQLLQQALPAQQEIPQTPILINSTSPEKNKGTSSSFEHDSGKVFNSSMSNGIPVQGNNHNSKNNHKKSFDKDPERDQQDRKSIHNHTNGSLHSEMDYIERINSVNDFYGNEIEKDKVMKGCNNRPQERGNKWNTNKQAQENSVNSQREKRNKSNKEAHTEANNVVIKDEYLQRLEADVKRLKVDLQASRQVEQDLRSQLANVSSCERLAKSELTQLQHHNDDLQTRLHGLVSARQIDKQTMSQLEKKLADERRARGSCEALLAAERKAKKAEEAAAAQAVAMAALNKGECSESCRSRRRELEAETKQLKRDLKSKEDKLLSTEREIQNLRQYKENHNESEILMSALSAMQEKNAHLENSLSAETRIKLDLFSALGEAKRQLEIRENVIRNQEKELEELKGKMAQVLAVMPSETFCPSPPPSTATSKFRLSDGHLRCFTNDDRFSSVTGFRSLAENSVSTLDPNATAYTPKGTLVTSTEA